MTGDAVARTVDEYLDEYSERVSEIMAKLSAVILESSIPEGADPKKYKFDLTQQDLRDGMKLKIATRGKEVGHVQYEDGVITARLDMRPILGKRP
jgi:hypothetical protein